VPADLPELLIEAMRNNPTPFPLTTDEHQAVDMLAKFWNHTVSKVVGHDVTRSADLSEIVFHVHALQRMIMANAAARCCPGQYRTLGGNETAARQSEETHALPD
jgi:hypothetical protein